MRRYELSYLISPDLSEEELKNTLRAMGDFVLEEGGKTERAEDPVRKRLAYPIKDNSEAFLATMYLELEPKKLESLEKKIKSNSRVIRYLILTSAPAKPAAPRRKKLPKPTEEAEETIKGITEEKPKKSEKIGLTEIDEKIEEILKE